MNNINTKLAKQHIQTETRIETELLRKETLANMKRLELMWKSRRELEMDRGMAGGQDHCNSKRNRS